MKEDKLRDLGIEIHEKEQYKTWCPVCYARKGHKKDKDLSVNKKEGTYNCHNSNCSFKGRVSNKDYKRPDVKEVILTADAVNWFASRGISERTLKNKKVGTVGSYIMFNYYKNGALVNYKKRNTKVKEFSQFPDAEKVFYNFDSLANKTKCIIVEGEVDVLTWVELGFEEEYAILSLDQGAGMKNSSLDGKLECLTNAAGILDLFEHFYLAGDNDEAGNYTFEEIARRLGKYRCKKVVFKNCKDSNECYLLDKSDAQDRFRDLIENAEPFPIGGIEVLDDERIEQMLDEYDNGEKTGDKIDGMELAEYFSVMEGEITLFSGYPSDGKSTFVRWLAMTYAIKKGYKFAFYAPEDYPSNYFYKQLCKTYMGKEIDKKYKNRATREEYLSAMNWVKRHFFYIYQETNSKGIMELPSNEYINDKIRYLKLQYGVCSYVKDPWNKLYHDQGFKRDDQYLTEEFSKEKAFAKDYRACWYVAHPKSPGATKDGKIPAPTRYDLAGGAMWNNAMDNILLIFRPNRALDPLDPLVDVIIEKIKKKKIVGNEGRLSMNFDSEKQRYVDTGDFINKSSDVISDYTSTVDFSEFELGGELPF